MKIKSLIFAAVLITASCLTAFGQLKRTTTKTDKLDFGAGGTVTIIGAPNGSIHIVGGQSPEVEITAEIEMTGSSEENLSAMAGVTGFITQEALSMVTISTVSVDDGGGKKKIEKKLRKQLAGMTYRIDYTIRVPRYCDIDVTGGKGDVTISGVEGNHKVNAIESDVTLDLIGGSLIATVGKGSLTMTIPNRSWRGGKVDAQVATGTLTANLPMNLSAELDATILRTGTIENDFTTFKPRTRTVPFTDKSIIAKAGVGGVPMKLTVGDGTLKLVQIGK